MLKKLPCLVGALSICLCTFAGALAFAADQASTFIAAQIAAHPNKTGVYVLDKGEDALIARAWLADYAKQTIEVQYFIWSDDNIGTLASEALLRAADRGVKVRVIVDDLLIKAPDQTLLALALHPNIDIKVYNPQHSVGVPFHKRLLNIVTDFRGVNQRMHDKTFIVDGAIAITGGRNMATEYFDYNHSYNFRDRDVLLLGKDVAFIESSFNRFWKNPLSTKVENLYDGIGIFQKNVQVEDTQVKQTYQSLHDYAQSNTNFSAHLRNMISNIPNTFNAISKQIIWTEVSVISDLPGKNTVAGLDGGGQSTLALVKLVNEAQKQIIIQSPYLVMSDKAVSLFQSAIKRGVKVYINTNSLAATDNIQAFSGYRNQREQLLKMGVRIYEYKPNPLIKKQLIAASVLAEKRSPKFAIHAKTMVIDSETVFIGTFNFDPRSENLNTEIGVVIHNSVLANSVENAIKTDMLPENSWNAANDNPDQYVSLTKRSKVRFLQMLPLKALL
ncbi:MAG: phospholipase D family protein [Methylotenera sp.]|nr:phospholipase D family protein [Methylotenera sp.]